MKGKERHDIKTDKFQELLLRLEEFVLDNAKTILYSIIGIIAVLVLYFGITGFLTSQQENASFALHKQMPDVNKVLALSTSEFTDEDINKARAGLQTVVDEHNGTVAANQAKLYLGILEFQNGSIENAEKVLDEFVSNSGGQITDMAKLALSGIKVSNGNYSEAAEMFKRLAEKTSGDSARLFSYQSAVMFQKAGDQDNATTMFNRTSTTKENDALFSPQQKKVIETALK